MTTDEAQKKLNADISSAIAAGMSYGKWIAAQPVVEIPKKPNVFITEYLTCAFCGCQFVDPYGRERDYCGKRCKRLAKEQRAKERGGV